MALLVLLSILLITVPWRVTPVSVNITNDILEIKEKIAAIVDHIQHYKREVNNTSTRLFEQQRAINVVEDKVIAVEKYVEESKNTKDNVDLMNCIQSVLQLTHALTNVSSSKNDECKIEEPNYFVSLSNANKYHVEGICAENNYVVDALHIIPMLVDYTFCHSQENLSGIQEFVNAELKQCGSNFTRRYCENGWTVIQRDYIYQESFARSPFEYKVGFGDLSKNFWYGNDFVHKMSYLNNLKLRVKLEKLSGIQEECESDNFRMQNELNGYNIIASPCKFFGPQRTKDLYLSTSIKDLLLNFNSWRYSRITKMMVKPKDIFQTSISCEIFI